MPPTDSKTGNRIHNLSKPLPWFRIVPHPNESADFSPMILDNLTTEVPEPSTALLLASGLVAIAVGRRRRI